MAKGSGTDAVSKINNPVSSIADEVEASQTAGPTQVLQRAVVVEVLYDLAAFTEEEFTELQSIISTPDLLSSAPRNSLIARPVTAGADKRATVEKDQETGEEKGVVGVLCYPFFPPHLALPIKPGEQVWLISDSPDITSGVLYWMCRIPEADHIDGINFTHGDRKFIGTTGEKSSSDKAKSAEGEEVEEPAEIFGFPNGPGIEDAYSLNGKLAYEDVVNASLSYMSFTPEPIPRFTKRPGDLVIQGSNNALICLGQDRGWTHAESNAIRTNGDGSELSNATMEDPDTVKTAGISTGAIDLVAGRGRYSFRVLGGTADDDPALTASRTVENVPPDEGREAYPETNKNPVGNDTAGINRFDSPTEGDPDLENDAARIYIAMASEVDKNFHIDTPGETIPTAIDGNIAAAEDESTIELPAAVVVKSDEIRLIARRKEGDDPVSGAPEINGSIRLIKEGAVDDDMAAIYILPDGTIQISGKQILLGRAKADQSERTSTYAGSDGGSPMGPDGTEPWVRFSDLKKLFGQLYGALDQFCQTLQTNQCPVWGPNPQVSSGATQLQAMLKIHKTRTEDFDQLASTRIWGE